MLHIICGPPGSGKTTRARESKKPTDLIFDFDAIAESIGAPTDNRRGDYIGVIEQMRIAVLRWSSRFPGVIWMIVSDHPKASALARQYKGKLTTLDVPADECVERIVNDQRPGMERRIQAVRSWWERYRGA